MAIFRYELRQVRGYVVAWTLTMGVLIYLMLPTYIAFLSTGELTEELLSGNALMEMIGASMQYLGMPMGVYGFLNAFSLIAAAIGGMHMGLATFTKEYRQRTADFLMTKPYPRHRIYAAKLLAAAAGSGVIWCGYLMGSVAAVLANVPEPIDWCSFAWIVGSFLLIQLFFLGLGALTGTLLPCIRAPLGAAAGCAFVLYIVGSFSRKTGVMFTRFLAPFTWFDSGHIFEQGSYPPVYMAAYVVFLAVFLTAGWRVYTTKDVLLTA